MQPVNQRSKLNLKNKQFFHQKKINRIQWTDSEINTLHQLVDKYGMDWDKISENIPTRTRAQCKQRWDYCNPSIIKGTLTTHEENKLIKLIAKYGTKWKVLHKVYFPHRSARHLANHWVSIQKRNQTKLLVEKKSSILPSIDHEQMMEKQLFIFPPIGYKQFVPIVLFNDRITTNLLPSFHSVFNKIT